MQKVCRNCFGFVNYQFDELGRCWRLHRYIYGFDTCDDFILNNHEEVFKNCKESEIKN